MLQFYMIVSQVGVQFFDLVFFPNMIDIECIGRPSSSASLGHIITNFRYISLILVFIVILLIHVFPIETERGYVYGAKVKMCLKK